MNHLVTWLFLNPRNRRFPLPGHQSILQLDIPNSTPHWSILKPGILWTFQVPWPLKTNMTSWKIRREWRCICCWKWQFLQMLCWLSVGVVCFFRECMVYLFLEPFVELCFEWRERAFFWRVKKKQNRGHSQVPGTNWCITWVLLHSGNLT